VAQATAPLDRKTNPRRTQIQPSCVAYPPGTHTFVAPRTGRYKFIVRGAGGNGTAGAGTGASGAYDEITVFLAAGARVTIVVAAGGSGLATTITLPNGEVVSCPAGANFLSGAPAGGVPSGGDRPLSGSAGAVSGGAGEAGLGPAGGASGGVNGGAGAPGTLEFPGAPGQAFNVGAGAGIGAGGSFTSAANDLGNGGPGQVIAFRVS
jgi:hypothetical protein